MSKIEATPWESIRASEPRDALDVIATDFRSIDERTDRILEITRSTRIECEIDMVWDSVMEMYYTAAREIARLRGESE